MSDAKITVDMKRFDAAMQSTLSEMLDAYAIHLLGQVQAKTPQASGILAGSFVTGGTIVNSDGASVEVGTPVDYGAYVEFGTKPHWAPLEALYKWVEIQVASGRINITVHGQESEKVHAKGQYLPRTFSKSREIYRVARMIQFAIAKRGTRPQGYYAEAIRATGVNEFAVEKDAERMAYMIDVVPMLGKMGFWDKLGERV